MPEQSVTDPATLDSTADRIGFAVGLLIAVVAATPVGAGVLAWSLWLLFGARLAVLPALVVSLVVVLTTGAYVWLANEY